VRHLMACTFAIVAVVAAVEVRAYAQAEDDLKEGDRYFEEGEFRRAAAAYDNAIRKFPGQVQPEAYGKRAAIFLILKQYDPGLQFIRQKALVQHPGAPEIREQEALILWAMGSKADAIKIAEEVAQKRPSTFSVQGLIGEFYANRDPEKTLVAYEAYLANRPSELEKGDVLPRARLGIAYLARARRVALVDRKPAEAQKLYGKAAEQFEILQRKHSKRQHAAVNAENGLCATYTAMEKFDQAITVCERIITDPRRIDANGSVWFNLGTSYLAKKQTKKARTAGNEYIRLRKNEARGYILVGDSYFEDRDWQNALNYYQQAEKIAKPEDLVTLSIQMGKTYRRLQSKGGDPTADPMLKKAIEKLSAGYAANPGSVDLAVELGNAYLAARQDDQAMSTVDKLISGKTFDSYDDDAKTGLLLIAGKALYNQSKVKDARGRFELAYGLRPKDVQVRRALVQAINLQAYQAIAKADYNSAGTLLVEAGRVQSKSPTTNQNLAVLALVQDDCDGAQRHLTQLKDRRGYALAYHRLLARALLCAKRPDRERAADEYALAEKEAKLAQANLTLAEVYTEWAPLTMDKNLDDAVDKLETAVGFSSQSPEVGQAARRNLALALFRRGWRSMRDGKSSEAAVDFEKAGREPSLLKGTEPLAFDFSLALARLDKGETSDASRLFKQLAQKGNQAAYLKPPYNKIGSQFFSAYANYRSQNAAQREQAANEFAALQKDSGGSFAGKIRDLMASSWEFVAWESFRGGKTGQASKALGNAAKYADGEIKRRVNHNREVLSMDKGSIRSFEEMNGSPPEALVNLGILYDQQGQAEKAYDTWVKARARGAQAPSLTKWIDAKKRIFGF
jgi:tetratricopeptide (TPR) repeat protein